MPAIRSAAAYTLGGVSPSTTIPSRWPHSSSTRAADRPAARSSGSTVGSAPSPAVQFNSTTGWPASALGTVTRRVAIEA